MQAGLERDAGLEAQRAPCGRQHLVDLGGTLLGNLFERRSTRTTQQAVNAWFSYLASPFAQDPKPVMIAVIDGSGDFASLSLHMARTETSDASATMPVSSTHLGCFTASLARRKAGGRLLAAKAAINKYRSLLSLMSFSLVVSFIKC